MQLFTFRSTQRKTYPKIQQNVNNLSSARQGQSEEGRRRSLGSHGGGQGLRPFCLPLLPVLPIRRASPASDWKEKTASSLTCIANPIKSNSRAFSQELTNGWQCKLWKTWKQVDHDASTSHSTTQHLVSLLELTGSPSTEILPAPTLLSATLKISSFCAFSDLIFLRCKCGWRCKVTFLFERQTFVSASIWDKYHISLSFLIRSPISAPET